MEKHDAVSTFLVETFLCPGKMSDESLLEEVKMSAITLSKLGFLFLIWWDLWHQAVGSSGAK